MPAKLKLNALGLAQRDYDHRFSSWNVPKMDLIVVFNNGCTFAETESLLLAKYGDKCKPKKRRFLHVKVAQRMKAKADRKFAMRLLGRRCTPEAQDFLLGLLSEEVRGAVELQTAPPPRELTQMEHFERAYGKLASNKVYRKMPDGTMVETKLDTGDNVEAPWANVFTKFET